MIDLSSRVSDYAIYLPAPNSNFARSVVKKSDAATKARLPATVKLTDLNFLDRKSRLYHYPNALYTGAFAVKDLVPTMISSRDRISTFVLGDSGGFSLISGAVKASQASFRAAVLRWQEANCDVGIILDVPTRSLNVPASGYTRFHDCLDQTKRNIEFALNQRSSTSLRLLNVMQGRDYNEARLWCEEVRDYLLDGLAIAGHTRLDLHFWIKQFFSLIDAGKFDRVSHIHFLGTAQPGFAVMATALQRALRKHVREGITVSFDSSLAFRVAQQFGQITTGLDHKTFRLNSHTVPGKGHGADRSRPFPFSSPLGDVCTVGDFLPGADPYQAAADFMGHQMISNHAVYMELASLIHANQLLDMRQERGSLVPHDIRMAVEAIDEAFGSATPGAGLAKNKRFLGLYGLKDDDERYDNA